MCNCYLITRVWVGAKETLFILLTVEQQLRLSLECGLLALCAWEAFWSSAPVPLYPSIFVACIKRWGCLLAEYWREDNVSSWLLTPRILRDGVECCTLKCRLTAYYIWIEKTYSKEIIDMVEAKNPNGNYRGKMSK